MSDLPIREVWIFDDSGAFVDALYCLLKNGGYFGERRPPETIEEILKPESAIDALLGVKGIE